MPQGRFLIGSANFPTFKNQSRNNHHFIQNFRVKAPKNGEKKLESETAEFHNNKCH
jgi:hypothetical protein